MNCQIRKPNIIQPGHSQTNAGILPLSFMVNSCKASFAGQKMVKSSTFLGEKMCPGARKQNVSNFFSSGSFAVGKGRNMENSVSCVGYVNIYDYGLVPEKPSVSTYQWVKYPNFTENQPFFICPKRKYQPQTEGICYLTNYCVTFTPPVKTKQRAAQKIRQKQSQGPSPTTHVPRACASVLQWKKHVFCALKQNKEVVWIIMMHSMYTYMYICTMYTQKNHRSNQFFLEQ